MMQLFSLLLAISLLCSSYCMPLPAHAAIVQFTPDSQSGSGTVNAEIPVNKVGNLLIDDGLAIIRGNTIDVTGKLPGSTQKQSLLSGVVVKTELAASGRSGKINGLAYFRQGAAIASLDDPDAEELIDIKGGGTVSGTIIAINRDEVEVEERNGNRRRIAMAQVKGIRSKKAFAFSVPIAAATAITLGTAFSATSDKVTFNTTQTAARVAQAQQSAAQSGRTGFIHSTAGKIIIGTAVLAGVATAIAVPIAVGVGTRRGGRGESLDEQALRLFLINQAFSLQERQSVESSVHQESPPTPPPPPPPPPP